MVYRSISFYHYLAEMWGLSSLTMLPTSLKVSEPPPPINKTVKLEWANIPKGVQTDSMRELQIRDPLSTDPDQPVRKSRFFQTDPFAAGWFPLCVWGKGGRRMPILWWEIFAFMTFLLFPPIRNNFTRFQVVWREAPGRWGSDTASISQSKNICLWLGWWLSRMRTISY